MLRSMFRVFFALAVALSLTFGMFSGVGTSQVFAASQPPSTAAGYNPEASVPVGMNYCYPSGYNKQGWRCGWRLAMYPYPMSTYNCGYYGSPCGGYYGTNCGYYGNPCGGYYGGYNGYSGTGGRNGTVVDYGGRPRYNPCYYYSTCYNPCYNAGSYCYGGYR